MYRVSIELFKHEWKFGRTRNAVGTRAAGECFHSFFEFSQTFTCVSITRQKHGVHVFYFFQKTPRLEKGKQLVNFDNHKNYNFLASDWFKNVLFSTNSLAKLLSDSLLLNSLLLDSLLSDSLISQSHSKMQFKSTNHIQSCNYVCVRVLLLLCFCP